MVRPQFTIDQSDRRILRIHRLFNQPHQVRISLDSLKLRELLLYSRWRSKQQTDICLKQHRRVVERIAGRNDSVVHALEGANRLPLLFPDTQLVIQDTIVFYHKPVAKKCRPAKLAQQRLGKLFKGVKTIFIFESCQDSIIFSRESSPFVNVFLGIHLVI